MQKFWTLPLELKPAGGAFDDPALLVAPANSDSWLLFDCGTLHGLKTRDLQKVRWLFLTHLHIDHLIGFDHLLRVRLFSPLPLTVYGPSGTTAVIAHRLKGYAWNLTSGSPFRVRVFECPQGQEGTEFHCHHSFEPQPIEPVSGQEQPGADGQVILSEELTVTPHPVEHGVPCLAYRLDRRTAPKFLLEQALRLGLSPGPWVRELVAGKPVTQLVAGEPRTRDWLADQLLAPPVTHRLGFLTDTRLDDALSEALSEFFWQTDLLCCETAYLESESELARQNLHMTTHQAATLASRCQAGALLIFHLSRRHCEGGSERHLAEVRQVFARADLLAASRAASGTPS